MSIGRSGPICRVGKHRRWRARGRAAVGSAPHATVGHEDNHARTRHSASKHAATSGIVATIAEELAGAGIQTTVTSPESVTSLEGYDGVVLGGGIYAGRWLGSAKDFVDANEVALASLPVWLFSSGPLGEPPGGGIGWARNVGIVRLHPGTAQPV